MTRPTPRTHFRFYRDRPIICKRQSSRSAPIFGVGRLIAVAGLLWIVSGTAGLPSGLDHGRRQVFGLVGQMPVDPADHRCVTVAHQLRQRGDVYAIDDTVGSKGVADFVGAQVVPEAKLSAEPLYLEPNRVGRPLSPVAVDENIIGLRSAPQEPHQPLHDRSEMNHPRLAGLVHGLVLREHPAVLMYPIPGKFTDFRGTSAGLPEGEQESLTADAAAGEEPGILHR